MEIAGSEIIGLILRQFWNRPPIIILLSRISRPDIVLENKLAEVLPYTHVDDVLDEISDPPRDRRRRGGGARGRDVRAWEFWSPG